MAWYGEDYGNRGGSNRDWSRGDQNFGYRNREMGGGFQGGNFGRGSSFDRDDLFDRGSSYRGGGNFGGSGFGGSSYGGRGFGGGNYGESGFGGGYGGGSSFGRGNYGKQWGGSSNYNRGQGDFDRNRMGGRGNQSYDRDFGDRIQEGWEGVKRGFRRTFGGGDYDRNYETDRNFGRMRFTSGYDRNW